MKNIEEVNFADEEFLHNKIKSKDVYMDYGAVKDYPRIYMQLMVKAVWSFDSIRLK